jgi:hypothetical protein
MKRATLSILVLFTLPAAAVFGCLLPREHACAVNDDCTSGNVCMEGACRPMPCAADKECGETTDCEAHACKAGTCEVTFTPAGPLPDGKQTAGDCVVLRCDGHGKLETVADPSDVPADDGKPCTDEVCGPSGPAHPFSAPEHPCSTAGGSGVCDGAGKCVACVSNADCTAGDTPRCDSNTHTCIACDNGAQDGDELGVDCGGACPLKCVLEACAADAECKSGHCSNGQCRLPNGDTCTGNAQCGSLHCVAVGSGMTCQPCSINGSPCTNGVCSGGVCSAP